MPLQKVPAPKVPCLDWPCLILLPRLAQQQTANSPSTRPHQRRDSLVPSVKAPAWQRSANNRESRLQTPLPTTYRTGRIPSLVPSSPTGKDDFAPPRRRRPSTAALGRINSTSFAQHESIERRSSKEAADDQARAFRHSSDRASPARQATNSFLFLEPRERSKRRWTPELEDRRQLQAVRRLARLRGPHELGGVSAAVACKLTSFSSDLSTPGGLSLQRRRLQAN